MAFFQNSVLQKHLKTLNKEVVSGAYIKFKTHFHNATIQENIRNSKEEQYQGEFLIDLFVSVLGYTKSPNPNFNLTTEYKNIKDSKKADGAIIINNVVKAVIELKGTNTTDLTKIETQAFGYKNNQPDCVYVITSNFEKLRLYIDNAIEFKEFNLFTLTEAEFHELYLCLAYENIEKGVPKRIKDESVSQEDLITKKLYSDYSVFKRELHQNLVKLNPAYEPLELFQKSQKLLDRFLFIFFAEDRQLLPTNLIFRINKEWQQLREMRIEVSLYERYKIYFHDLNVGAKVSLPAFSQTAKQEKQEFDIYAYNGGLFAPDEVLNNIKIDDALLFKHTENLSHYDFASEVDVNILGHIFENSLNELDELKAQAEGLEIDKTKTKRKKDGVFYTPKYITKYIVENTVGKLCSERKDELQLNEQDYFADKKRQKKTTQALADKLTQYRNWLLQLTICDPACGSGAFLNQALDFLITEHRYIDELQAKLFGDALMLSDVEGSILENNLFGVDINEESVEIAKLSLWLRTAQPNRKLNDLNNNIKCGNSLIDDVAIAGDKAFDWNKEFKIVFAKGGFDVVIGNPPYVDSETMVKFNSLDRDYISNNYKVATGNWDLYIPFIEKSVMIVNNDAYIGLITPNKWLALDYGKDARELIFDKLFRIIDFTNTKVFDSANISSVVFVLKNSTSPVVFIDNIGNVCVNKSEISNKNNLSLLLSNGFSIVNKLNQRQHKVSDYFSVLSAFTTGEAYELIDLINDDQFHDDSCYKFINTGTIDKYISLWGKRETSYLGKKILYPVINKNIFRDKFPRRYEKMNNPKLIITGIRYFEVFYDEYSEYVAGKSTTILLTDIKMFYKTGLCLLNSKLISYYIKQSYESSSMGGGINFTPDLIKNIPTFEFTRIDHSWFSEKVDKVLVMQRELTNVIQKFSLYFISKFNIEDPSAKLVTWFDQKFSVFIFELNKSIKSVNGIILNKKDEFDWMELFEESKKKVHAIKARITQVTEEIDIMIYKLYELTEEEIRIVEGGKTNSGNNEAKQAIRA